MTAAEEFSMLIAPVVSAGASAGELERLLREVGVLTARSAPLPVPTEITELAQAASETTEALLALDDPAFSAAERIAGIATGLASLFEALAELTTVQTSELAAPFDSADFWGVLARRLPPYLLNRWLEEEHTEIFEALRLTDVAGTDPFGAPRFDFARLVEVVGDLSGQFGEVLGKDLGVLIEPIRRFFDKRGATELQGGSEQFDGSIRADVEASTGVYEGVVLGPAPLVVSLQPVSTASGPGIALSVSGLDAIESPLDLGSGWTIQGSGGAGLGALAIGADWAESLPESTLDAAEVSLTGQPSTPWVLLGGAEATRLEMASASIGFAVNNLRGVPEPALTFSVDGLKLVLTAGESDSFLAAILGSGEIGAAMSLHGQWSSANGLTVEGAAGLTIHISTSIALGPVTVNGITLAVLVAANALTLEISAEVSGSIGPVSAAVTGMGLRLILSPESEAQSANRVLLGPIGAELAVKPPTGVGFAIDAGVASGGGFLNFVASTGRYDGVVDVQVLTVGITAVVIIDTLAPDVDGWSMFFALFLDLPSIQLGFGFTLTGVGGLAGINRTIDTAALEAAVRSGALDTVLFPENPIEDAPIIIDQLRSMFPPADGQYVFGPVVRIGWGTPTLIEAEIGIVVTFPDPVIVAVLGSVTSILPTPDLDLVALRLDVAGVIDFAEGSLAVDASLHDSYIACFALSGDMALRASFGYAPSFLLALGGFHPGFIAPDDFPEIQRLRLAIGAPPILDISFESYFALTSNTVQFGADFDMSADIAGFGLTGGTSFDALVYFSPFKLITSMGYYVTVTAAGVDLLGVWLDATVSGPNPWRIIGDARFKILGIRESVHIDERIGQPRSEPALTAADPRDEIVAALENPDSWAAVGGSSSGVLLASSAPGDATLAAFPDGTVTVSQKVAPLKVRLDKIGDAPLGTHHTFDVQAAPGSLISTGQTHDWFAPGYYFELAANEQLSTPSFEWMASGAQFGGGAPLAGNARPTTLSFEEILRDPELDEHNVPMGTVDLAIDRAAVLAVGGAGSARAQGFQIAADPAAVTLDGSDYAVIDRSTGALRARANTWSAARQSIPGRRRANTVVPSWELPS